MALILHATKENKNAYKTLIAAEYVGVKVQLVPDFQMGVSNKTPQFLKMNLIGKVPVLETPDGPIFESNAIARYVARLGENNLFGSSPIDQAHVEQWIDFSSLEIDANLMKVFLPRLGFAPYLPPAEEAALSALKRSFEALNTHLASNTYLVGESVTLADIITTANLYLGFAKLLVKSFTSEFPHVERYFCAITDPFVKWISNKFKYLRVLNIQGSDFQFLPDCFDKMKHLRYLDLSYCRRLEKLPDSICKLQSLEVLNLCKCVALAYIPQKLRNLVSLRILWITITITDLSFIGIGNLKHLQILILWNCDNLVSLPRDLRHLTSLKRLTIEACYEVTSFEDEEEEDEEENENYPLKLERLSIDKLTNLAVLPGWLRRCGKTLRYLGLSECSSLMALPEWLVNLTSLETLLIADCRNLALPQHMDRLQNLQNLKIYGCPKLIERCKQNTGSDWYKIAHIPNVELGSD